MSSRRKNPISSRLESIDLDVISNFLRIIGVMIGSLLIITVILFLCSEKTQETSAVYALIISINGIFILLALVLNLSFKKIIKK